MRSALQATAWVVAGPPGAGKTTVARSLSARLSPPAAMLDKDTVYGGFAAAVIATAGEAPGRREGPWYELHVKAYEYAGLAATARDIRASGCPVVLVAPYTNEIHDPAQWRRLVEAVGGEPVRLVWLDCDADSLFARLVERASANDAAKLADYRSYVDRMRPGEPPAVAHVAIDNRGPITAIESQVDALVAALPR
ncbi:MAG TPA: AAA family ATPase [Micromonosporaceae bacterium]|jgi:predicted kinase|nr:AAA family ATPase [Micromonosporaceae bacterium]